MAMKLSPYDIKRILRGDKQRNMPVDDFRLLDSWTEYEEDGKTTEDERKLKYLCYEIEVMNPENGDVQRLFKAIKLMRVVRVPKGAKQDTSMMDVHAELLSSCYDQGYNLITVIANIMEPVALGLLFLYGVQGTASNIEDAKEDCDRAFVGLVGMLTATYRVLHIQKTVAQETEWLRHKMYNMDYLTMVRGIPEASNEGENVGNKGFGGTAVNPGSRGTLEEIILGMADYEYVIQVISSPVYMKTLKAWSTRTQEDMTDWNSQLQGAKSISMNISMPMMFMANASQSSGWSHAYTDAESVSFNTGESFTTGVSESLGTGTSQSLGESFGRSIGDSFSQSQGFSLTDSVSNSYSISQGSSVSQNVSFSEGFNTSTGQSFNEGSNISQSLGLNEGHGTSTNTGTNSGVNQGVSTSTGQSVGQSFGNNQSFSQGQSLGISQSSGWNQGLSQSVTNSVSQGSSVSHNVGVNDSVSQSMGQNIGGSSSNSWNHSLGTSTSDTNTNTWGGSNQNTQGGTIAIGNGNATQDGNSASQGNNSSVGGSAGGFNASKGQSFTIGGSSGGSESDQASVTMNQGASGGKQYGFSNASGEGTSNTFSTGGGNSQNWGQSMGQSVSSGMSQGWGYSDTVGQSTSVGTSESFGVSGSVGTSQSNSITQSFGISEGVSNNLSLSNSLNDGWSQGFNLGTGTSRNMGTSVSDTVGSSLGHGTSESFGTSQTRSHGSGISQSTTISQGTTQGRSVGQSINHGHTQSVTDSTTQSITNGISQNMSKGTSQSIGQTAGQGLSRSESESLGTTGAIATGMGGSMGFGPSIGYNKSYQWLDQQVKDILELLEFQNERLKQALRGGGAFYTYVYIATETRDGLSTAMALAKSAWHSQSALSNPIQVLNLSEEEQHHLLNHFSAFSADITREMVGGVSEYKYATVLLNTEYVAYNHLPRVSEGGVFAEVEDIPKFSTPSMLKGEVFMGNILSAERFTFENGYLTPYEYRIAEEELMHGFITGSSGSGKTVMAMRLIAELSKVRRKKTGKRLRLVCLDPKSDWRALARFVEPERFRFYHMANPEFHPISLNPCKIPYGVRAQYWVDVLIEIFCRSYGLLERGKQLMAETFYSLYDEAGVFKAQDEPNWKERIPELSRQVTFAAAYNKMKKIKQGMDDGTGGKGKGGHDTADAYARLLERLSAFERDYSIEYRLYGKSDGLGVDELIGADDVTVLESKGLEQTFKNFIFGVITSGFYRYAIAQEGGYLAEDQFETVLMIEEANEVLIGNDTASGGQQVSLTGQSEFEQILDQARGYGLYIFAVTQKISQMPTSVLANSAMKFAGRVSTEEDANVITQSMARDSKFDNRDIKRLFPRMPTGWFVCRSSNTNSILDSEPILTKIAMLNVSTPSDKELDEMLTRKAANAQLNEKAIAVA